MTTNRRPPGTPTGGQFAPVDHPEASNVELDDATHGVAALLDDFGTSVTEFSRLGRRTELLGAKLAATILRHHHPTARYLLVESNDQGSDDMVPVGLIDGDLNDIDEEDLWALELPGCTDELFYFVGQMTDSDGPNYWTEFEAPEEERDRLGESHPEVIRRHGPSVLDLDKALAWDPNGPSEQP